MKKYVTLSWWDDVSASDYLARTIHEEERRPVKTGLLDKDGTPLYRVVDHDPIGFIRHKMPDS